MSLRELVELERRKWKEVERDLSELMRSYDRECDVMTANRLNGLRTGRLKPRPIELRALLEYSNNLIDGFRD